MELEICYLERDNVSLHDLDVDVSLIVDTTMALRIITCRLVLARSSDISLRDQLLVEATQLIRKMQTLKKKSAVELDTIASATLAACAVMIDQAQRTDSILDTCVDGFNKLMRVKDLDKLGWHLIGTFRNLRTRLPC